MKTKRAIRFGAGSYKDDDFCGVQLGVSLTNMHNKKYNSEQKKAKDKIPTYYHFVLDFFLWYVEVTLYTDTKGLKVHNG